MALEQLLDAGGDAILAQLVASATDGRPWAVRLAVDRLLPARRERRVRLDLGQVATAADVARAMGDVIACAAAGELTLEESQAFLRLLDGQRKALETSELAVRLELLEASTRKGDEWRD